MKRTRRSRSILWVGGGVLVLGGALRRSEFSGFHNVMLYDAGTGASRRVLSLGESDPGSGASFGYRWTPDSKALLIEGAISGTERRGTGWTEISWACDIETGTVYDLGVRTGGDDEGAT